MRLKQLGVGLVLAGLLLGLVTGCQPQFQPGTYTDDAGRAVAIDRIPRRIVSHVPSITETLFALGLGDRVVGVSDYGDYPPAAGLKPSVGSYFNPSIENIVALDPDLVLTDGHSENIKGLESLGITFFVIDPQGIDGILENIALLGKITGTEEEAAKLIDDMRQDMAAVSRRVKDAARVKVFYIIDATDLTLPWTVGPGSFADALITLAGGENAAKARGAWVQLSLEEVVSADPEIIILTAKHGTAFALPATLKAHPAWRGITAVRQDRIYTIDGDLVDRSGPRIVQGLEEMAKIIHPELFKQ